MAYDSMNSSFDATDAVARWKQMIAEKPVKQDASEGHRLAAVAQFGAVILANALLWTAFLGAALIS